MIFLVPLGLFLAITRDSWCLSNTSFTMYSLGILGNCLLKMFFRSISIRILSRSLLFQIVRKSILPSCSRLEIFWSRFWKPKPVVSPLVATYYSVFIIILLLYLLYSIYTYKQYYYISIYLLSFKFYTFWSLIWT